MEIRCREKDGVMILDLSGPLTIGDPTFSLRVQIRALSDMRMRNLVINMDRVTFIDSSGLDELVSAYTTFTRQGGVIKLLHLNPEVHRLLVLTKLITVFKCYDQEDEAVRSFHADS